MVRKFFFNRSSRTAPLPSEPSPQRRDVGSLAQNLQHILQEQVAQPNRLQIRCAVRDGVLLLLVEHLLHIEPDPEKTFAVLEQIIIDRSPGLMASDPDCSPAARTQPLPARIYIRIAGYQQPYAFHSFTLEPRSTAKVAPSAEFAVTPPEAVEPEAVGPVATELEGLVEVSSSELEPEAEIAQTQISRTEVLQSETTSEVSPEDLCLNVENPEVPEVMELDARATERMTGTVESNVVVPDPELAIGEPEGTVSEVREEVVKPGIAKLESSELEVSELEVTASKVEIESETVESAVAESKAEVPGEVIESAVGSLEAAAEIAELEVVELEVAGPEAAAGIESEIAEPEDAELEDAESERSEFEDAELEDAELEVVELEVAELEAAAGIELEITEPEDAELEDAESERSEFEDAKLEDAELEAAAGIESEIAELEVDEPEFCEAVVAESVVTEPEVTEPEDTVSEIQEEPVESAVAEPERSEFEDAELEDAEPEVIATALETIKLETEPKAESEVALPKTEAEIAELETTEAEGLQTEVVELEAPEFLSEVVELEVIEPKNFAPEVGLDVVQFAATEIETEIEEEQDAGIESEVEPIAVSEIESTSEVTPFDVAESETGVTESIALESPLPEISELIQSGQQFDLDSSIAFELVETQLDAVSIPSIEPFVVSDQLENVEALDTAQEFDANFEPELDLVRERNNDYFYDTPSGQEISETLQEQAQDNETQVDDQNVGLTEPNSVEISCQDNVENNCSNNIQDSIQSNVQQEEFQTEAQEDVQGDVRSLELIKNLELIKAELDQHYGSVESSAIQFIPVEGESTPEESPEERISQYPNQTQTISSAPSILLIPNANAESPLSIDRIPIEVSHDSKAPWRKVTLLGGLVTGSVSLFVVISGAYVLTRPCVLGNECEPIQEARRLSQRAIDTIQNNPSAPEVVDAHDQLNQVSQLLEPIPFWSRYHTEAQGLLSAYSGELNELGIMVAALNQANTAAKKSLNPPHPVQTWREVQWLWRETINSLEQIPETSPVYALAQNKRNEYEANLESINHRLRIEQETQERLAAVRQASEVIQARSSVVSSTESWQQALDSWETLISNLQEIPQGTMAYSEAQRLIRLYQLNIQETERRREREAQSMNAYQQANSAAEQARLAEQRGQWAQASTHWREAVTNLRQIQEGTANYSQAQALIASYTASYNQAEENARRSSQMQTAIPQLNQACSGNPQLCSYTLGATTIQVQIAPSYDLVLQRAFTAAQVNSGNMAQADVPPQLNQLLRSLAVAGETAQVPVELYNAAGAKFGAYDPDRAGYILQ